MNDCIYRQAAIDEIVNTVSSIGRYDNTAASYGAALRQNEIIDIIENLPSAQPEQKWIPVTERLPESGTRALVMRFDFVTKTPFYDLLWFDKGKWWNRHFTGDYAVTNWMPLPEPPKEGH